MIDAREKVRQIYHYLAQSRIDCEKAIAELFPVGAKVQYHHSLEPVQAEVIAHDLANWRIKVRDLATGWEGDVTISRMEKVEAPGPRIVTLNG